MIYLIIASLLLPLILILLYLSYYNIRILRGLYIAKKFDYVSSVDYETIPLIPIRTNINFPSAEHGLLIFDVTNIYQEQSQKMYTGSTIGGINVPFATLGYTKRRFYQKKDFLKYGETNIVVSNIHIHLSGYDYPNKAKLIIREIESLSFCDYGSTVLIRNEHNLTYKIKFKTLSEALYFVNSIWTIKYNGYKFYRAIDSRSEYLEYYVPKSITKWDIRRLKNEYKQYPELKKRTWSEIKSHKLGKKSIEKGRREITSTTKGHEDKRFIVDKDGKRRFFFENKRKDLTTMEEVKSKKEEQEFSKKVRGDK